MAGDSNGGRRPGPVSFHSEAKVTSLKTPIPANEGIGAAAPPSLQTPRGAKELKVLGPITWGVFGLISLAVGAILLSIPFAVLGFSTCVGAYSVHRRNLTERRLRDERQQGKRDDDY